MRRTFELTTERWGSSGGDVYFIQSDSIGNPIKIGRSFYPERRLKQLQISTPHKLCLITTIPDGGKEIETKLKSKFRKSNISGEWFKPSTSLMKLIGEIRQGIFPFVESDDIAHFDIQDEERIERMAEKAVTKYRRAIKRDINKGMSWYEIQSKYHITAKYYRELKDGVNVDAL